MLFAFLIFIIILFLYIHIQEQYKKSEDLEIYEMDYTSNDHLQTVCAMKQPVLFEFALEEVIKKINDMDDENAELKVWDTRDYETGANSVDPILLIYRSFMNLAKSDPKGHYFSKWEHDHESDEYDTLQGMDMFFCPKLCAHSDYSLLAGAAESYMPLQYHMSDRRFLFVTHGRISVKMTPWRSRKYIDTQTDYENYEFYSRLNPWSSVKPETGKPGIGESDKIKWLNFDVGAGYVLYIPPWWWYSVQFSSADSRVAHFQYQTYANILAHTVDIGRYYFQFHTTKRVLTRTLPLENGHTEVSSESIETTKSI